MAINRYSNKKRDFSSSLSVSIVYYRMVYCFYSLKLMGNTTRTGTA